MSTVVGLYANLADARESVSDLIDAGFNRQRISFLMRSERVIDHDGLSVGLVVDDGNEHTITTPAGNSQRVMVAGPWAAQREGSQACGSSWNVGEALRDAGLGPFAANRLEDAVCAGAIVVAVHCEDRRVPIARVVLDLRALSDIPSTFGYDTHAGGTLRTKVVSMPGSL